MRAEIARVVEPPARLDGQRPLDGVQGRMVACTEDAMELLRWLSTKPKDSHIALDTECTGLSIERDKVRLAQIGDSRMGWVIPFERWGGVLEDVVRRYEGLYVCHNATYDVGMLHAAGIPVPIHRVHDTRLMAHVLSSTGPLGLKDICSIIIDPRAAAGQQILDDALGKRGGWTWETVPLDYAPYVQYAALDPILTSLLFEAIYPMVMREAPKSYELELGVSWPCFAMERHGVRIDREYVAGYQQKLLSYITEVDAWCLQNYGIKNPGSDRQVIEALQREGLKWSKRTGGGNPSLDKDVLAELMPHPLAQAVFERRRAVRTSGTYLVNYLEMSEFDGLIHASINTIGGRATNPFEPGGKGPGVRTGRMSMSDPNLQNVPRRGEYSSTVRRGFVPSPGNAWVKADLDQIEMRTLAHLATDRGLREAFLTEGDFFVNMARQIYNDETITKDDPRRDPTKNAMYALSYGAGAEKFANTAGIEVTEAIAFMQRVKALYPGIPQMQREIENLAVKRRHAEGESYIRSPLTNRKHVADPGREYALLNYEIQGMAGEVMKMKIIEADQAGLGDYMLFPVHDEIDLDVPAELVDDVIVTLRDIMNDDSILSVPVTASVGVGPSWGQCRDVA